MNIFAILYINKCRRSWDTLRIFDLCDQEKEASRTHEKMQLILQPKTKSRGSACISLSPCFYLYQL